MGVHYIPPADKNEARLDQIRTLLHGTLEQYITGKGRKKRIESAVDDVIRNLKPMLKLAKPPDLGATIMTESAATRNKHTNDFTTKPRTV